MGGLLCTSNCTVDVAIVELSVIKPLVPGFIDMMHRYRELGTLA